MAFVQGEDLEYITERFSEELQNLVELDFFTRGSYFNQTEPNPSSPENPELEENPEAFAAEANRVTAILLGELAAIAPEKIKVNRFEVDSPEGERAAAEMGLDPDMLPAIIFKSENLKGKSRFFGLPSGYEFGSLVENIIDFSKGESSLKPKTIENLAGLGTPVQLMVFVTPT